MTPDRYQQILDEADAKVRAQAELAYGHLLAKIRAGDAPQTAINAVMKQFNAGVTSDLAKVFSALLATKMGPAAMRDYKVGGVKLSDRLYAHAQAVSATTRTIIEQHMKGPHSARELAKTLYEGYNFKEDELKVIAGLPKYLKDEFNKAMAAKLKTPALRAAYLKAIKAQEAGKGTEALAKVLKTAFYERNRYFANRIARTELHRNYTDQQSREYMATDRIQYLQYRMSGTHKITDICDYFAKVDAYGMGAGVYPKAKAPQPPLHPFCKCVCVPMIALSPKLKPKFNPNAEQAFLASLPPNAARQIAGSRDKLERALKGGESLEEIYNEGKDALYQWKRVGDVVDSNAPGQQTAPSWRDDPEWLNTIDAFKEGAGWAEEGGRIVLDADGKFLMRTKWAAKEQWYGDYVAMNATNRVKAWKIHKVIEKAQNGERLGKAEDRFLQWLHEYMREQNQLNTVEKNAVQSLPVSVQTRFNEIKARFIEQVGDYGNEVIQR